MGTKSHIPEGTSERLWDTDLVTQPDGTITHQLGVTMGDGTVASPLETIALLLGELVNQMRIANLHLSLLTDANFTSDEVADDSN